MPDTSIFEALADDVDADRFSSVLRSASDRELDELMASEHRKRILDEVFDQMPERLLRERAVGIAAVIQWRVGGSDGDDVYQVTIRNGACRVERGATERPDVTFRIQPAAFLKLIGGKASGVKLVLARKLRVEGDVQLAMRVERLFDRS